MRIPVALLLCCALAAALLAGCGSGGSSSASAPSPAEARNELEGSPPPLAALHRQANALLPGGEAALRRRLAQLRGRPVVVNVWAAWCAPCKQEFPHFQRASVRFGREVAFLGVNTRDVAGDARSFLDSHWVAYPSYVDPDEHAAHAVGATIGIPVTVFYDRGGRRYVHQGPYREDAALAADIKRYAVGGA
jgi:cytochrome c biogenesis protein CcmG/thiol:disulfide interchange protein DsbE